MKQICVLWLAALAGLPVFAKAAVEIVDYEWTDPARNSRAVPVRIYAPKPDGRAHPLIIFSHGLGGTREAYRYLGNAWAEAGFISVHVQHAGSDDAVWRNADQPMAGMRRALQDPAVIFNRAPDVSFAIDRMLALGASDPEWKGRIDGQHIGVAGHSFGAHTSLMLAGMSPKGAGRTIDQRDPRVDAAVILSPTTGAANRQSDANFGAIRIPCLHITGTQDESSVREIGAEDRRIAYDHTKNGEAWLITFEGGRHMDFGGVERPAFRRPRTPQIEKQVIEMTTKFWKAFLEEDRSAAEYLRGNGLSETLGKTAVVEHKIGKP